MIHNVSVNGTMSHQGPMAMQAKVGAPQANKEWRNAWRKCYNNKLLTYLPDTFTTDVFLRDFTKEEALIWNLRQDSGNPDIWVRKILDFYKTLEIDSKTKTIILSDSLTDELFKEYTLRYRDFINVIGGIGTYLSNDCGHKALNIVIKLAAADFGDGMVDVVKLSDIIGKYTGLKTVICVVKEQLGIS
jgi:nicotinate phosphoribosyltransferase